MRLNTQTLRNIAPILLGVGLFIAGLYALYHLLRPVNAADVIAQIKSTPFGTLIAAFLATVIGYIALVCYDWYGMRFIGKKIDTGVVAIGGFLGYAFGNTIGVSVISGGAVRYRIYSAAGLNAFEVAAVTGYIAIALGTGMTIVGVAALIIHPAAIGSWLPYSTTTIQMIAIIATALSVIPIAWLSTSGRALTLWGRKLRLPPLGDLGGQLIVTVIDIAAASFALWVLLPVGKPDYSTFIAIYAAATMIGILSHVPGGVGVFETVVIGALPASVPVGDAAAGMLLFRIIYYLIPFALAFLVVALNEIRLITGRGSQFFSRLPALQTAFGTLHGISPALVATVAFGSGVWLLLITMLPTVQADAIAESDLIGVLLLEGGTIGSAVAGVALIIVSNGLARRVSSAWVITMGALLIGSAASLINDFGYENAIILFIGAILLLPFRKAFDRPGRLSTGIFDITWFASIVTVSLGVATFFFFMHKTVPYSHDLLTEFTRASNTPRALRAGLIAAAIVAFFGIYLLTRPVRKKYPQINDPQASAQTLALCARSHDPQSWLSQSGDKRFLISPSGEAFIMYAIQGGTWIALGDPIGNTAEFEALVWAFADQAAQSNAKPVFYETSEHNISLWLELGLTLHKVGEEAIISLPDFSLEGRKFKTMRAALNKRQRDGYGFAVLSPPHSVEVISELQVISNAWLNEKTGHEKGFSVGRFDHKYLDLFDIAVIRKDHKIIAFSNIFAGAGAKNFAIDLMRYLPEEASGMMEYMFLRLIEHYKHLGGQEFSLGTAPLSGLANRSFSRSWNRFGRFIYRHGGALYNFEGLRGFKQKFQPQWRPRYLVTPATASPMRVMGDVALLIAGSARGLIGK